MLSLEQVKLLETKVTKAIEFVERVTGENAALQATLESYQKRIDELEVVVMRFKEDQGRIEDGILSALDRLNTFESAIEKSLKEKNVNARALAEKSATAAAPKPEKARDPEKTESARTGAMPPPKPVAAAPKPQPGATQTAPVQSAATKPVAAKPAAAASVPGEMFFEIPEAENGEDISDPLEGEDSLDDKEDSGEELDIF